MRVGPRPRRQWPDVSDHLIEHIENVFPNKLPPEDKASEKELWIRIGQQRVVDHLRNIKKNNERQDAI